MPVAFPTTPVLDDANRPTAGPPPSASWTTADIVSGTDGLEITAGQLKGNGGADNEGYWNVETFGPDTEVFGQVTVMDDASGLFVHLYLGLLNIGTGTTDGYLMRFDREVADDEWNIGRIDDGVRTFLDAGVQRELTIGDYIGFSRHDDRLTAWHFLADGTVNEVLSVVDATYSDPGNIGLMIRGGVMRMDNFGGGTVVPSPAIRPDQRRNSRRIPPRFRAPVAA